MLFTNQKIYIEVSLHKRIAHLTQQLEISEHYQRPSITSKKVKNHNLHLPAYKLMKSIIEIIAKFIKISFSI